MRIFVSFFISLLFVAFASMAVIEPATAHCQRHLTQSACSRDSSGECFWNLRENRCHFRSNAAAQCLQMSYRECQAHGAICQWHPRHHQCEGRWN